MSTLTDEWHLKRENGIKYWIDIHGFNKKMKWRPGKEIYSRKLKISESVFSISIYPNGNTSKEKGYVSVYLCNESSWRVMLSDVTFKVGQHEATCESDYYQADKSWGLSQFVSHEQIKRANLLDKENDRLTLEVDIELLEEEVAVSRPVESEGDVLLSLKSEVSTIKEEVSTIKEELESQKTEIKNMKCEILCELNKLSEFLIKMAASANSDARASLILSLESPSCTVSP